MQFNRRIHAIVCVVAPLLVAFVSGCTSTPPTPQSQTESGVSMAQFLDTNRWVCTRVTFEGEVVTIHPTRNQVSKSDNPVTANWYCQGAELGQSQGFAVVEFHADVNGFPVSDNDRPGDALIGASLRKEAGKFFIEYLTPGGAADQSKELRLGDRVLAVAETADSEFRDTSGLDIRQVVWLIRGQPETQVKLRVIGATDSAPREITLTRAIPDGNQLLAVKQHQESAKQEQQVSEIRSLVIQNNTGIYMSPYTSDGVTAEWVNKAINANLGASAGSAIGGVAGAYAADKALSSVPFAGVFGGMLGASAGKSAGRDAAIKASGGWAYIRSTSDQSFRSLPDMAKYLKAVYGHEASYTETIAAAVQIYPELAEALRAR